MHTVAAILLVFNSCGCGSQCGFYSRGWLLFKGRFLLKEIQYASGSSLKTYNVLIHVVPSKMLQQVAFVDGTLYTYCMGND